MNTTQAYADHQYANSVIGNVTAAREGELQAITNRILTIAQALDETAYRLREHADAVLGPVPEVGSDSQVNPVRCGLIGNIHDALDRLEASQSAVAAQAGRNCALA